MKKAHVLKKQEARLFKRLGPVTEENADTYPIGNPYAKMPSSKSMGQAILAAREELKKARTPEEIAAHETWVAEHLVKWKLEDAKSALAAKRKKVRRLFFK